MPSRRPARRAISPPSPGRRSSSATARRRDRRRVGLSRHDAREAKGEYIAKSADWYHPGAFQKSDFHQFTEPGNAITGHPVTVVEREGNGVRVSLVEGKVGNLAPFCNGEPLPEENEGFCAGTLEYRVYHARADWLFRDCE